MFRQTLLVFVSNSVRIGQNLLTETPVERSVLAYFANYHLNSSNGRIICMGPYGLKTTEADYSAVARGGAGGPVFFLKNKNRPV